MLKLNAAQLRESTPSQKQLVQINDSRRELYLILDNIYDTYNIGGLFRLGDAVGAKTLFLCGRTECPPNPRIDKSAIGTHKWLNWEYHSTTISAINHLRTQYSAQTEEKKQKHLKIAAIEQSPDSVPLSQTQLDLPLALVVGDETAGVSPQVLQQCDLTIETPMHGINKSLNVIVAASMVLGKLM